MLRFITTGQREFGKQPMLPHARPNWEFYVVTRGSCAPLIDVRKPKPQLYASSLWVFPPGHVHGWIGDTAPSTNYAFHFSSVPPVLQSRIPEGESLRISLTDEQCEQIAGWYDDVLPFLTKPNDFSELEFERVLIELSRLMLRHHQPQTLQNITTLNTFRIESAEAWYTEHLQESPSVQEAAKSIGVSPSHLRRLFWQVRQASPRSVFTEIRLKRAMDLMAKTTATLDSIALECGFGGASDFSRAFKHHRGISPAAWRKGEKRIDGKHTQSGGHPK